MTCIPPDTLSSLDSVKMLESKRDLQHALGLLMFWRKHTPDFSIVARPLYDLLQKRAHWEWTSVHDEVLRLLGFEANAYQALGPIHPTNPIQIEWGFAQTGLFIYLWEKGLFVVSLAVREAEQAIRKQTIVLRGPFKVTKAVLAGTSPPDGVALRASV